ncbi:MAG TPA: hypothetical protein VIL32_02340 [Steroidobacteraceae bacterium]
MKLLVPAASLLCLCACASTPDVCDMQAPLGGCEVAFELRDGAFLVCAQAASLPAEPACAAVTLDVVTTTSNQPQPRDVILPPGECRELGMQVISAAQQSCRAFRARQ